MAGTASDIREQKVQAYEAAKRSGVKGEDLATLKAAAQAARATELSETGGNDQAGYLR